MNECVLRMCCISVLSPLVLGRLEDERVLLLLKFGSFARHHNAEQLIV